MNRNNIFISNKQTSRLMIYGDGLVHRYLDLDSKILFPAVVLKNKCLHDIPSVQGTIIITSKAARNYKNPDS